MPERDAGADPSPGAALPRVVLVDDHGLFRAGVAHELAGSVDQSPRVWALDPQLGTELDLGPATGRLVP